MIRSTALALVFGSAPLLAGCLPIGGSLDDAQATCTASTADFGAAWHCIRARVAAGTAGQMNNGPAIRYMATGDLLAERVRAHQVSDAEARVQLASELARGDAEFQQQQTQIAASGPIVCNHFGSTTVCN